MKRNLIAATVLGLALGGSLGAAYGVSPSPEQTARSLNAVPSAVVYSGNYDRMNAHVTCYEGVAAKRTNVRGYPVKAHHWVEYCNDGWVSVQVRGDKFHDIKPA